MSARHEQPHPHSDRGDRRAPFGRYGALLGRYLRPQWRKALLMATLLLGSIGLQLLIPQILRLFIDAATGAATGPATGETSDLLRLALLFLGVALVNQLLGAAATYTGADVGWTATNLMREDLARHCLDLDMAFHTDHTAGEMIERIDGDITALSNFFSQFSVRVFGGLLLLLGILVLLWLENPLIGLALTLFVGLELIVLSLTRSVAVPATTLERETSARLFGFIEERLAGLDDIRANGAGAHALYRFTAVMREFFAGNRRAWMMRSVIWLTSYGLFTLGMVVTLGSSIVFVQTGAITLGTGYMVFQYMLMLQNPIDQITRQMQELQKAAAGIGRVEELFATTSALAGDGERTLPDGALPVSFERVDFAYGDHLVLRDVSFRLLPGRVLGLLGRTGSGKTTLTRLLFRLYDPAGGTVRIGGVATLEADPDHLRGRVAMVTQEVQLFGASVRDNLTFFGSDVPDARILEVLDDLGLGPWLARQPDGLDTTLVAGGGNLSAGEAQLLAFARVFLKDPGLVVLDEPSSRLDPATEALLERAVDRLLEGRTAIVIAHRLETVERADDILVMDGGRVAEFGRRDRLAADPTSRYARLVRAGGDLDAALDDALGDALDTVRGPKEAA